MDDLAARLSDLAATTGFSGTVVVEQAGEVVAELAAGHANRAERIDNRSGTRFAAASVTKGFTALTILSLVDEGVLDLDTPVRSIVDGDLPLLDPGVTIDHLLTHRSGVGDHLDESELDDIEAHVLGRRSAHTFTRSADYLDLLAGLPPVSSPGERFAYNNGGFVILSLVVERLTGSFHTAVEQRVFTPAGMTQSGFFRSDDLPERTALGYLRDGHTNVFHLPVIGAGDGGVYLSGPDCLRFWSALWRGGIVPHDSIAMVTSVVTPNAGGDSAYGRGVWLGDDADHVWLEGMDAGVSARTGFVRSAGVTYAVLSNTSSGAWPLARAVVEWVSAHSSG